MSLAMNNESNVSSVVLALSLEQL